MYSHLPSDFSTAGTMGKVFAPIKRPNSETRGVTYELAGHLSLLFSNRFIEFPSPLSPAIRLATHMP